MTAAVAAGAVSGVARVQQGGVWSNALAFTVPGGGATVTLAPNLVNLVVGETRTIQATGANGQPLTGLAWTTSDAAMVSLSTDDPPVLTAMAAGHATVKAGTASVDVTVWAGTLPVGTVIWSNPGNGSGVYSIVPAVPSPTGVADVFAFQGDGTVQAITSEGKTAWTADVSMAYPVVPDFQGGLVGIDQSGYSGAIVKWDGMTGQRGPAYTPSGTLEYALGVHTDGTVFAMQRNPNAVIGVDPALGTQKFSIPVTIPGQSTGPYFGGMIIGGDGYAYVPYSYRGYPIDCSDGVGLCEVYHLRLLRIASGGSHDDIPIADVDTLFSEVPTLGVHLITNGDTGALLSWSAWNGDGGPVVGMAVTNGTSVSLINGSMAAGQASAVEPVLQAQDGSFVGTVWAGEDGDTRYMVAFDAAGSMRWSVAGNYQPQIATVDGVTIATSDSGAAVMFDANGVAVGQIAALPTQSWLGHTYRVGSTDMVAAALFYPTTGLWAFLQANQSHTPTATGQLYGQLEDCGPGSTRRPQLACPQPKNAIFNAWYWLKQRLADSADRLYDLDRWVFTEQVPNGAARWDPGEFSRYLQSGQGPEFYDGEQSNVSLKDAGCDPEPGVTTTVMGYFQGKNANKRACGEAARTCNTGKDHRLRTFFEPLAIGFDDPNNSDPTENNIALLFHEALHGFAEHRRPETGSLVRVSFQSNRSR